MPAPAFPLTPEPIHVPDQVLDDLRGRLRATRWSPDEGNEDGRYGVPAILMEDLVTYWADGYDWRAAERAINAYEHYYVEIDGAPGPFSCAGRALGRGRCRSSAMGGRGRSGTGRG